MGGLLMGPSDWHAEVATRVLRVVQAVGNPAGSTVGASQGEISGLMAAQGLSGLPGPYLALLELGLGPGSSLLEAFVGETVLPTELLADGGPSWRAELCGQAFGLAFFGTRPVFYTHQDFQVFYFESTDDHAQVMSICEEGEPVVEASGLLDYLDQRIARLEGTRRTSDPVGEFEQRVSLLGVGSEIAGGREAAESLGLYEEWEHRVASQHTAYLERRQVARGEAHQLADVLIAMRHDLPSPVRLDEFRSTIEDAAFAIQQDYGSLHVEMQRLIEVGIDAAVDAIEDGLDEDAIRHAIWRSCSRVD